MVAVFADLDANHIRIAADRAAFDVFLARPGREVERDHNLLDARIADVAGLVVHGGFASTALSQLLQHLQRLFRH